MYLDDDQFRAVVAGTPLVSIDLIVENDEHEVLLGLRRNRPARGSWFVPGGRIRKGESLASAFSRIAAQELGLQAELDAATFAGVHQHFYEDSVFGEETSTHYVVLAYRLRVSELKVPSECQQHSDWRWWPREKARLDAGVHEHSRAYFQEDAGHEAAEGVA